MPEALLASYNVINMKIIICVRTSRDNSFFCLAVVSPFSGRSSFQQVKLGPLEERRNSTKREGVKK